MLYDIILILKYGISIELNVEEEVVLKVEKNLDLIKLINSEYVCLMKIYFT